MKIFEVLFRIFLSPENGLKAALKYPNRVGIVIGVFTALVFSILNSPIRINTKIEVTYILGYILFQYVLLVLSTYGLAKLFGGKGNLMCLASLLGWASVSSLPLLLSRWVFIYIFVLGFTNSRFILMETSISILIIIMFIWYLRISIQAVSKSMNLEVVQSLIIFIIASVISQALYMITLV